MLFALICIDKPNSVDTRMATRPDHLAYLKSLGGALVFAGPFTNDEGKPTGSLMVMKAESIEQAREMGAADPYSKAGLFETVDVKAWTWAVNAPADL